VKPPISVDPALPTPIWSQIEEAVRVLVATGGLARGEVLPSVRELARELRINPNTAAKAYQRLVEAGVVETRRGEGTFVAERPPTLSAAARARRLREAAARYVAQARASGAAQDEAAAALEAAWNDSGKERKGGRR
jgi:GntR family transcriptional regulator